LIVTEHLLVTDSGLRSVMSADLDSCEPEDKQVRVIEASGSDVRFYAEKGRQGVAYRVHENGSLEIGLIGAVEAVRVYSRVGWLSVEGAAQDSGA
jgi:hypothetical protein